MNLSAALAKDLAALDDALDDGTALGRVLETLVDNVKAAVASYLGLTMTLVDGVQEVSFTVREGDDAHQVRTSLRIPLGEASRGGAGSCVELYAAAPGAFVDLAADLSVVLAMPMRDFVLDGRLVPPDGNGGLIGLAERSAVDQAVGALIGRGHTPETALAEVQRRSAVHGVDLAAAARLVFDDPSGPPDPEQTPGW